MIQPPDEDELLARIARGQLAVNIPPEPVHAWLGASIPAAAGSKHFVQLLAGPRHLQSPVLASAFGLDEEDALERALALAGASGIEGRAQP